MVENISRASWDEMRNNGSKMLGSRFGFRAIISDSIFRSYHNNNNIILYYKGSQASIKLWGIGYKHTFFYAKASLVSSYLMHTAGVLNNTFQNTTLPSSHPSSIHPSPEPFPREGCQVRCHSTISQLATTWLLHTLYDFTQLPSTTTGHRTQVSDRVNFGIKNEKGKEKRRRLDDTHSTCDFPINKKKMMKSEVNILQALGVW